MKPLYYSYNDKGDLFISSEIKALHAVGLQKEKNDIYIEAIKFLLDFEIQNGGK